MLLSTMLAAGVVVAAPEAVIPLCKTAGQAVGRAMALFDQGKESVMKIVNEADDLQAHSQEFSQSIGELSALRSQVRQSTSFSALLNPSSFSTNQSSNSTTSSASSLLSNRSTQALPKTTTVPLSASASPPPSLSSTLPHEAAMMSSEMRARMQGEQEVDLLIETIKRNEAEQNKARTRQTKDIWNHKNITPKKQ